MGFFSNLFKKKVPEQAMSNNRDMYGFIDIERDDGTILQIKETLDKEGRHQCQNIIDQRTGEQLSIPQYTIMRTNENGEFRLENVLMELTAGALQDPQYSKWIANDMLSSKNMERVLNEQHGYAGGVHTRDGQIIRTSYRPGIAESLEIQKQMEKDKKLLEGIRGMDAEKYRIYQEAQTKEVHIKEDHAQVLTPDMNPYRNNNRSDGYDR